MQSLRLGCLFRPSAKCQRHHAKGDYSIKSGKVSRETKVAFSLRHRYSLLTWACMLSRWAGTVQRIPITAFSDCRDRESLNHGAGETSYQAVP